MLKCSLCEYIHKRKKMMITLLSRIFIKNKDEKKKRKAYGTLCSIVGILLNILLFIGKMIAGVLTGSVAISISQNIL